MTVSALQLAVNEVSEDDVDREFAGFSENPDDLQRRLDQISATMSDRALGEGISTLGGVDALFDALVLFVAYKAALVRKGFRNGPAAGAAAAVIFGDGRLAKSVAEASCLADGGDVVSGMQAARYLAAAKPGVPTDVEMKPRSSFVENVVALFA